MRFLHFTNGGHTRKSIMSAPMFLRIKRSMNPSQTEKSYNDNDIMTTNKLPGMYYYVFLITVIFPKQNQ
jgi:hypothetical protein